MKGKIVVGLSILSIAVSAVAVQLISTESGFIYPANMKHKDSKYYAYGDKNRYFQNRCHLANDYNLAEGSPVYAITSGVVEKSAIDLPFYGGDDGSIGGAMIVKHKTSAGKEFYALYGHVKNFSVKPGAKVKAGQKIAEVGPFKSAGKPLPHLHFGINTTQASYEGYTPSDKCSNYLGFVKPEEYMNKNYTAEASCKAVIDKVSTKENTIVSIQNVLKNDFDADGDKLSVTKADTKSAKGAVIINNGDGTFKYTPKLNFVGNDTFSYTISDGKLCSQKGVVSVSVEGKSTVAGTDKGNDKDKTAGTEKDKETTNGTGLNIKSSGSSGGGNLSFLTLFVLLSGLFIRLFRRR